MPSYSHISWTVSYRDEDGTGYYRTSDGLPPNHGRPPPPSDDPPVIPFLAGFPAASSTRPPPVSQPSPVAIHTFRPTQQPAGTPTTGFVDINFIRNGVRPHRDRYTGRDRDEAITYTPWRVATSMKMKDLIESFDGSGGRGFTECKLLSDGYSWAEVQTFKLGDDSSEKTLAEVGWTASRGVDGPPVWVSAYHEGLVGDEEKKYWEGLGFVSS